MIVTAQIKDRQKFIDGYGQAAAALVAKFGGRYILRGGGAQLLEGNFGAGASMVISQWPDRASAETFWNSPDYAEVKKMREGLADCQVILIDGPPMTGV
jgi:uncharacterized protein (DUF1330 family)